MTNHHWEFSIAGLRQELGFDTALVMHDFTALAMALPHLDSGAKRQVGGGTAQSDAPIGLLGAGTGLGVSGLILSGSGLELIYRALCDMHRMPADRLDAAEISRRALEGVCDLCDEAIDMFCAMLGTAAGNLAVTLGAQGGVYIGGGIVPRLGERFDRSSFRRRFEQKGRFGAYLADIPTYVITAPYPAFAGAAAMLAHHLEGR